MARWEWQKKVWQPYFAPHFAQSAPYGREKCGKKSLPYFFFHFAAWNGCHSFGKRKDKKYGRHHKPWISTMLLFSIPSWSDVISCWQLLNDYDSNRQIVDRLSLKQKKIVVCARPTWNINIGMKYINGWQVLRSNHDGTELFCRRYDILYDRYAEFSKNCRLLRNTWTAKKVTLYLWMMAESSSIMCRSRMMYKTSCSFNSKTVIVNEQRILAMTQVRLQTTSWSTWNDGISLWMNNEISWFAEWYHSRQHFDDAMMCEQRSPPAQRTIAFNEVAKKNQQQSISYVSKLSGSWFYQFKFIVSQIKSLTASVTDVIGAKRFSAVICSWKMR